jgi:hypothetical protein
MLGESENQFSLTRAALSTSRGAKSKFLSVVIDVSGSNPVRFEACNSTEFFANQTSAGALIPGFNIDPTVNVPVDELSTYVEDAAIVAF